MSILKYLAFIIGGFGAGSIMFSYYIPMITKNINITKVSPDGNPGVSNAVTYAGWNVGLCCLIFDLLKAYIPVFVAFKMLDKNYFLFPFIITSPVLGHAIAPINSFKGGKGIAASFGALIACLPNNLSVIILAVVFIFFSTIFKIYPMKKRSAVSFSVFAVLALLYGIYIKDLYIAAGCILISAIVIYKHLKAKN